MTEIITTVVPMLGAVTALLTALIGGMWKIWDAVSKRIDVLKADIEKLKEEIDELEADIEKRKQRDAQKDKQLHTMGLCLRLLIPELKRQAPASVVLKQVRALLDQSFPVDPDLPQDMASMLLALDSPPAPPPAPPTPPTETE